MATSTDTGQPAGSSPVRERGPRRFTPRAAYRWFRRFRRTRPFYGALFTALGGFLLYWYPHSPLGDILHVGVAGISGMGIGILEMIFALFLLFAPSQRHVVGVIAVVGGVASLPLSNLGGFFFGMFFTILGGSMAFGWMPEKPTRKWRHFRRIKPDAVGRSDTTLHGGVTAA